MNCPRETEILRSIEALQWPDRCDDELRIHAAACPACADLVDVATALTGDRDAAVRAAHVPPAGAVWWRTQMRARHEAARSARRVISVIQAAAVLVALLVLFVVAAPLLAGVRLPLALIAALASPLLLAPIAVYLAVAED